MFTGSNFNLDEQGQEPYHSAVLLLFQEAEPRQVTSSTPSLFDINRARTKK